MIKADTGSLYYKIKETVLGQITIIWGAAPSFKVKRILLPSHRGDLNVRYPEITPSTSKVVEDLSEDISEFLEGEDRHFNIRILDLDSSSMFQRKVLHAEYRIPRGWVSRARAKEGSLRWKGSSSRFQGECFWIKSIIE